MVAATPSNRTLPYPNHTRVHRYVAFDYHTECKGGRFGNLSSLMEEVQGDFSRHGYVVSALRVSMFPPQANLMGTGQILCAQPIWAGDQETDGQHPHQLHGLPGPDQCGAVHVRQARSGPSGRAAPSPATLVRGPLVTRTHALQLADMNILPLGDPIERYRQFEELFRSGVSGLGWLFNSEPG